MNLENKQSQFINSLLASQPSEYEDWFQRLGQQAKTRVESKSRSLRHGLTSIAPLICLGPTKCPFINACPIPASASLPGPDSDYPLGLNCVLEHEFTAQRVVDYLRQLKVDPDDPIEMSLINELTMIDLMKNRAALIMSVGDSRGQGRDMLSQDETVDTEGNVKQSTRMHPAVEIVDRLEKRRGKLLDKFLATREAQVKVLGGSQTQSLLMEDIKLIRNFVHNLSAKPQSLLGGTVDEEI